MISIGIMQGRLVPRLKGQPYQCFPCRWYEDTINAFKLGLKHVEFIYDNTIVYKSALDTIRPISTCLDYFMDNSVISGDFNERIKAKFHLVKIIEEFVEHGVKYFVLPFVDQNSILQINRFLDVMDEINVIAHVQKVKVCVETDLTPLEINYIMKRYQMAGAIGINYDTGNSASLGYDPIKEFEAYGKNIKLIHIKDRLLGGESVPYREGDTDFPTIFKLLKKYKFNGPVTLQLARPTKGEDDVIFFEKQYKKFKRDWEKYF